MKNNNKLNNYEAVSKVNFMKINHCPNPKGKTDFRQLLPSGSGQKVAENYRTLTIKTASIKKMKVRIKVN